MAARDGDGSPAAGPRNGAVPSYDELAAELLEALEDTDLVVDDVRHELEPGAGERRFECTVRLTPGDAHSRYHAHLSFVWDALMTYVAAYGGGADCDLYHDDDEEPECPHRRLQPQPVVEVQAEFVLGDGGYELQDVSEVSAWRETVGSLVGKAFAAEERPTVHLGLAFLGSTAIVEKLTAEHSWLLDFDDDPDLGGLARTVQEVLRIVPQLADRLPV